jgi:hypothetical protein
MRSPPQADARLPSKDVADAETQVATTLRAMDWLNDNAGSVTAAATVVYALVTLFLAFEARAARRAATKAAAQADAALREERELNVLPYLAAVRTASWQPDGSLGLQIAALNVTDHPALRVTVKLLHGS